MAQSKAKAQGALPPGVQQLPDGRLVRYVEQLSADGSSFMQQREVALTLEEARTMRADYYHPELGWILGGYKLAKDRSEQSRLRDDTGYGFSTATGPYYDQVDKEET